MPARRSSRRSRSTTSSARRSQGRGSRSTSAPVRYAVVGMGYIAQKAVLPAFENAARNSVLAAIVSGDETKLRVLGRRYGVPAYTYEQFDELLGSGLIDAVYIALPNNQHAEYSIRAARYGIHVLCEKPMAVTEDECRDMIDAAQEASVKLMVAYRLHFDPANLRAIEVARGGKLGKTRLFTSDFCMQVKDGDIRLQESLGGGPLYDIGVYCINAARYLFRAEPEMVWAHSVRPAGDRRFREVDETTSAVMHFPDDRVAAFTCSFGTTDVERLSLVGTKGKLHLAPAYSYRERTELVVAIDGRQQRSQYESRDQFGPELLYFSDCIRSGRDPEPSGDEGLADVRIVEALLRSQARGKPVSLDPLQRTQRPTPAQEIRRPQVRTPALVEAESPHTSS